MRTKTRSAKTYQFRLRFQLQDSIHLNSTLKKVTLFRGKNGIKLSIKGETNTTLKDSKRLAIIGGPYPSMEQAADAAERTRLSLLIWAAKQRLGIDLGSDYQSSYIFPSTLEMLTKRLGVQVRNDIHGIDVYENSGSVKFASVNGKLRIGKTYDALKKDLAYAFSAGKNYDDKLVLACELYSTSFLDSSVRSRFITLVTAAEALLVAKKRSVKAQELIEEFVNLPAITDLDEEEKKSLISALEFTKKESIGQTGKLLADQNLPDTIYDGRTSGDFFKYCYNIRSKLLHNGKSKLTVTELKNLSNTCSTFIGDLLDSLIGGDSL